jgi:crotonobetainyl-CoA:carnitine CoA-transferase CaiB-like acyl-CoA transferase
MPLGAPGQPSRDTGSGGAVAGLKVVEFAQLIAAPFAGTLLADFGADVIHVEDPRLGDSSRNMGPRHRGAPLWWKVAGRNKRSVTIDLRLKAGQALAHRLIEQVDVMITNFRPATLELWGLDWPTVHALNPRLIMLQVSGFGADSSRRGEPGFGKVGEAMSGAVYLTGPADGPPMHTGFSHGDSVSALGGAMGILLALFRAAHDPDFQGEWIDLALFEMLFRINEWQVVVYDQLGRVPERAGNRLAVSPGAVVNTYETRDGHWVTVTSATLRSVLNVVRLLGLPEGDFMSIEDQTARADDLDAALNSWVSRQDLDECLRALIGAGVVASKVYSMVDIMEDATYREREDIVTIEDRDLGPLRMQAVLPRLLHHGGTIWRTGPNLGEDNNDVFSSVVGLTASEIQDLARQKVI